MLKKTLALLLAAFMFIGTAQPISVLAATENEAEVVNRIDSVKDNYEPNKTFFVSNSPEHVRMVGEDNMDGDKTKGCFADGTDNSHGRFGGLWQSNGFAKYVFNMSFGSIPMYDYHCNPSSINSDKIEVVGRYADECRLLRGNVDGEVTVENVKTLLSKAKAGDILVLTPKNRCNLTSQSMVIQEVNNAGAVVYQADFSGNCVVTENTVTFDAIAEYHCVSLLTSKDYPMSPEEAPGKVQSVAVSQLDYALNENISVSWQNEKWATSYNVSLVEIDSGKTVEYKDVPGNMCTFSLNYPGEFKIGVVARNSFGDSEVTYSKDFKVHNYNIVKFVDYDGALISSQKVQYGADAIKPANPKRKGYEFIGWDTSVENITGPTTIKAEYEIIKYTVSYYKVGGKELISEEKVAYGTAANPPVSNLGLSSGYIFAGWHIEFDDTHQCADYNKVDSDMKLVATECWENDNLPILITLNSAVLQEDGKTYKINATLKNYDKGATSFKVIVSLKTSIGKTVKSVPYKEVTLAANATTGFSEDIVYSEKITTIELVAVGVKDNVKTTGAYSKAVSTGITAQTNWYWGGWSDWTTENRIGNYDSYDAKTQYRYNTRSYTTNNTTNYLDGWERYHTDSYTGGWSGWQNAAISPVDNAALRREVQTQVIPATYKTQYRYGRWKKTSGYVWYHFCKELGKSQQGGTWATDYTAWGDSRRTKPARPSFVCSYSHASHIGNEGTTWYDYGGSYYWEESRQVEVTSAYTQYRYRDTTYTHYFRRWGGWSGWQDAYVDANADRLVETRTLYRYRNKVTYSVSDPNAGTEDNSGNEYSFSGTVPETTADLNGKIANLMVYKKTNSDPTEAQLEHVGQITIGSGNTYNISFRTREEPSVDTGDFIVTLGVEGADNLVNIEVIKADLPTYTVRFFADDGTQIGSTQTISKGESANVPEAPEKVGYTFLKWSENTTNIQGNVDATAIYGKSSYTLSFVDWETGNITNKKQFYGDVIEYPVLEPVPNIVSRAWDKQLEGVEVVSDNLIIQSVAEYQKFNVTFAYDEGDTGAAVSQVVEYGKAAVLPDKIPTKEGMVFADWSGVCSYNYITCDVVFTPIFMYEKTVATPVADVTKNEDGTTNVRLSCDTIGANIYYIIEDINAAHLSSIDEQAMEDNIIRLMSELHGIPTEEISGSSGNGNGYTFLGVAQSYDGSVITLEENQTIVYMAMAENMNDSIPGAESNDDEMYYGTEISKNNLRQYKNSIEGSVVVKLSNNTSAFEMGLFTLCFYDNNGIMIKAVPFSKDLTPGENTINLENIVVNTTEENVTCKLISVVSGKNIKPISDVIEFAIN